MSRLMEVTMAYKPNLSYQTDMEKLQESNLPVKEKLILLDRDIVALRLTDHEVDKRVRQLHRLVRTQMFVVSLNIIVCLFIIYLIMHYMIIP